MPSLADTVDEMLRSMADTTRVLCEATDAALPVATTHACGMGRDTWTLLTTLIDHEIEHMQQVIEARNAVRDPRTAMERLAAEWMEARVRFLGTLAGLSDEEFNQPRGDGEWTLAEVAGHLLRLERDALATMRADGALPAARA
jgi:uncharacterized damage-inducible protein DinB